MPTETRTVTNRTIGPGRGALLGFGNNNADRDQDRDQSRSRVWSGDIIGIRE